MTKEYYAHSLPGRQKCKKFKLLQRFKWFERFQWLERTFMEECGGNGDAEWAYLAGFWHDKEIA